MVARFEQERQALALMDHPHIAVTAPLAEGPGTHNERGHWVAPAP